MKADPHSGYTKMVKIWSLSSLFAFSLFIGCHPNAPLQAQTEDAKSNEAADTTFDPYALWARVRADLELFYAYLDLRNFDGEAYLDQVGIYVTDAETEAEFRKRLHRATYAFTDPHLGFGPFTDDELNIFPTSSDLVLELRGDDYVIADVRAGSDALLQGLRPGMRVTQIEGVSTDVTARSVYNGLLETPNVEQLSYAATLMANGRRAGTRSLTVRAGDNPPETLTLANPRDLARAVMERPAIETQRITLDTDQVIAVLRINNRLGDNDLITAFDAALTEVWDADGIIIDLRNTPSGGNTEVGRSILGHFTTVRRPFQRHERPSLEREFSVPRHWVEHVVPREPFFFPEFTVVLGGYWTGSMGEGLVIGFDEIGVKTIASDMGGLLGGMSQFSFADGRIRLSIPTETLFHVNGTPREDFVAKVPLPSADSDESGGDPALEAALNALTRR